jgi:hypothetical protein
MMTDLVVKDLRKRNIAQDGNAVGPFGHVRDGAIHKDLNPGQLAFPSLMIGTQDPIHRILAAAAQGFSAALIVG